MSLRAPLFRLPYPVVLLNRNSQVIVDNAARRVKWMSDSISKQFDINRFNPFELKLVRPMASMEELNEVEGPKVRARARARVCVCVCVCSLLPYACLDALAHWHRHRHRDCCIHDAIAAPGDGGGVPPLTEPVWQVCFEQPDGHWQ